MMNTNHTLDAIGSACAGCVAAIVGQRLLGHELLQIGQAFILGAAGAAGGWLFKKAITKIFKTKKKS